jgi:hypothetical protein
MALAARFLRHDRPQQQRIDRELPGDTIQQRIASAYQQPPIGRRRELHGDAGDGAGQPLAAGQRGWHGWRRDRFRRGRRDATAQAGGFSEFRSGICVKARAPDSASRRRFGATRTERNNQYGGQYGGNRPGGGQRARLRDAMTMWHANDHPPSIRRTDCGFADFHQRNSNTALYDGNE